MTTISEAFLEELTRTYHPTFSEDSDNLRRVLSEADIVSYRAIEKAFYPRRMIGSKTHKLRIADVFTSPLISDAAKEYFAAANLSSSLILSVADKFLTEAIFFSYFGSLKRQVFDLNYFMVLIESEHFSERIISAVFRKLDTDTVLTSLELTPDAMITPKVMDSWMLTTSWIIDEYREVASLRIKQAHPDYAEFPDEWVLKVFCGNCLSLL